jgi:hypothetical protein
MELDLVRASKSTYESAAYVFRKRSAIAAKDRISQLMEICLAGRTRNDDYFRRRTRRVEQQSVLYPITENIRRYLDPLPFVRRCA